MGSYLLIINPVAGKLRARSLLMDIIEAYSSADLNLNVRLSQYRGHARAIARAARASEYERVVCVGGDGTLNEVITGLLESGESIPLGYIPLGSTNDFAASIGLNRDVAAAARATIEGMPCLLDVGSFDKDRKFAYIASFGMLTAASYTAPQSTKNILGHFAYILEGIKDIVSIKSYHMKVTADGQEYEDDFIFGAVANSTSIAGIVKLDQNLVNMSDGLFEVILIRKIRNPAELNQVLVSLLNSNFDNRMFLFLHASRVEIVTDEPSLSWSLDGEEAISGSEILIEDLHSVITLIK